jgi:hypothetical protein
MGDVVDQVDNADGKIWYLGSIECGISHVSQLRP